MKRILVVEDDKDIIELVRYNLEKDGYQVAASGDGATGLAQIRKTPPDLLILDLMLPKFSGLDICKEVRRDVSLNRLPILILTAKGEEADRVVGLELGADDYVTKPFSPRELVARVKALLRRAEPDALGKKYRNRRAANRSRRLSSDAGRQTRSHEYARIPLALLPRGSPQSCVHSGSVAGRRLGHRTICNAAQRGCVRAAPARKNRNRSATSGLHENNSRRRLSIRNPCELGCSGNFGSLILVYWPSHFLSLITSCPPGGTVLSLLHP